MNTRFSHFYLKNSFCRRKINIGGITLFFDIKRFWWTKKCCFRRIHTSFLGTVYKIRVRGFSFYPTYPSACPLKFTLIFQLQNFSVSVSGFSQTPYTGQGFYGRPLTEKMFFSCRNSSEIILSFDNKIVFKKKCCFRGKSTLDFLIIKLW